MKDKVELVVKDHSLIITPCRDSRLGWENDFKNMARYNDDLLLDEDISNHSWDVDEWQW